MKIAERFKLWICISLVIIVAGFGLAAVNGFNLGIDFTGGTMMQINLNQASVPVDEVQELIKDFNLDAEIVHAGSNKEEVIIKTSQSLSNADRVEIFNKFVEAYGLENDDFRGAEQFGPSVGSELQQKALMSILIASIGMLIYISFRFEVVYGVTAIIALIHDVLILLAVYSLFNIPVNSSFIAAVLTIVGYSINDTIVVFDRVRENVKLMKRASFNDIANTSLLQTFSRSINTSLTTLLVIGALYFLGVESIKEFALPLMAGIITGTYSSIFIASPLWAAIKTYKRSKEHYSKA
ncbi:MAG: protein translocase subunit SecF [Clostridia bacterium]|nr:protein translocase subunit SecF [Clostridia bacterium]